MAKTTVEECRAISIFNLKKWGCLKNTWQNGGIVWKSGLDEKENSVNYTLNLTERYFELNYRIKDAWSDEWEQVSHKYPLITTPCHYSGQRYWFECSLYKNGYYCGRRVAKLYLGGGCKYFACRHCLELSYDSCNQNHHGKFALFGKLFDLDKKLEKLHKETKILYRKDKLTKKGRKMLDIQAKLNNLSVSYADLDDMLKKP